MSIPENRKVGGSTPPLATHPKPQVTVLLGLRFVLPRAGCHGSDLLQWQFQVEALPGSIWRVQILSIRSGQNRRPSARPPAGGGRRRRTGPCQAGRPSWVTPTNEAGTPMAA